MHCDTEGECFDGLRTNVGDELGVLSLDLNRILIAATVGNQIDF